MEKTYTKKQRSLLLNKDNKSLDGFLPFSVSKYSFKKHTALSKRVGIDIQEYKELKDIFKINDLEELNFLENIDEWNGHWRSIKRIEISISKKFIHSFESLKKRSPEAYTLAKQKAIDENRLEEAKRTSYISLKKDKRVTGNNQDKEWGYHARIELENRTKISIGKVDSWIAYRILELVEIKSALLNKEIKDRVNEGNKIKLTIKELIYKLNSFKKSMLSYQKFITSDYGKITDLSQSFKDKENNKINNQSNNFVLDENINIDW